MSDSVSSPNSSHEDTPLVRVEHSNDHKGLALIWVDYPPVNALGQGVRQGLLDALDQVETDPAIEGAVLLCAGRTFIAGADLKEFGKPLMEPQLPAVIARLEACSKPLLAAVHGSALGGGCEVALGCHFRIAASSARFGLPEVNLGIVPGAGGTQRLPRLVGPEKALDMIISAKPVNAQKALTMGLIDVVSAGDLQEDALNYLAEQIKNGAELRRISTLPCPQPQAEDFWDAQEKSIARRARGQISPLRAMALVKLAGEVPFDEGLAKERATFVELRDHDQSGALRHAFFAENQVAKIDELKGVKSREINDCAVIGGGTMGVGITVALLSAGCKVMMIERDGDALARGQERVKDTIMSGVKRGRVSEDKAKAQLAAYSGALDYDGLRGKDLIIEAVFEDLDVKRGVFKALNDATDDTILATNTSYLDVNKIAEMADKPENVIGLHFFSPAHIMKLLEIVKTDTVSKETLATSFALAKKIGKVGVLAGICDGFIGNRILSTYRNHGDYLLEDGCLPHEVDGAMKDFGFAMGLYEVQDMAGLDIGWANRKRQAPTRDPRQRYIDIGDKICEQGHYGQKTGQGWYLYEEGKRGAQRNPEVEELIIKTSEQRGITRRQFSKEDIQTRILSGMINEAVKILEESIARTAGDIDMVEIHGYGFPRWRGGLCYYADHVGLDKILANLDEFAKEDDYAWAASDLLRKLVAEGRSLKDLEPRNIGA